MRRWWVGLFIVVSWQASLTQAAACWDNVRQQLESPQGVNATAADQLDNDARKCLSEVLADPDTLNRELRALTASDSGWAFLRDVQWKFKTFEAPDATGASHAHLGVGYSYDKSIATAPIDANCGATCVMAVNLRLSAQGNIALQSDVNPRDFLETHLSLAWFRSSGGARRLDPETQDRYNALALQMATIPAGHEAELEQSYRKLARLIAGNLTNQTYIEFATDVSLESDQRFRQKNLVYAARAAIDFRGWSGLDASSWDTTPAAGQLNIFDYPFALLRRLTGYAACDAESHAVGSCFTPLSTSWPTLALSLGRVSPSAADPRRQLPGGDTDYTRLATEVAFKTPIAKWQEQTIYVAANYRWYDELSASAAVKQADLDNFRYLAVTIGPQRGVFASYSTGRLPFDHQADRIYELGFRTYLQ